MYPFGMKVRVKSIIKPAYITWIDEVDKRVPTSQPVYGKNLSFTHTVYKQKLAQKEMRQVDPKGYHSALEGEALPQSLPVPDNKKRHRRLRRHKAYHQGVIVGWTWMAEGMFMPDDINFLVENRRQWGHQVALNNDPGTKHAWTTSIVFCLVEDLDPFDL